MYNSVKTYRAALKNAFDKRVKKSDVAESASKAREYANTFKTLHSDVVAQHVVESALIEDMTFFDVLSAKACEKLANFALASAQQNANALNVHTRTIIRQAMHARSVQFNHSLAKAHSLRVTSAHVASLDNDERMKCSAATSASQTSQVMRVLQYLKLATAKRDDENARSKAYDVDVDNVKLAFVAK